MKAIIGLGNPGLRFRFSRHNVGFLIVERLAKAKKIKIKQRAYNCLLGKGRIESQEVLLAKPLTFMNLSGQAIAPIVKRKKIKLADLLIILDDVNLPLGKIRIRAKGSDGGHKGLRSIIEALGRQDFPRIRIGVGRPKERAKIDRPRSPAAQEWDKLTGHVLGRFIKKDIEIINASVEEAISCCQVWVKNGVAAAMNRFN